MKNKKTNFKVFTYSINEEKDNLYPHWADNLKMVITKDDSTMKLNSEEIKELVNSLPRTIGGTYK